jgi:ATP-dependent DNA helicase PIF1
MVWLESADVTLQYLCPQTGTCQRSSVVKATRVGFCLDETDRRVLTVGRDRALQEWAVQGGVRVHNRFMEHGKLTLHLVKRNLQLLLSNADPAQLRAWCRALAGPPAPRGEEPAKRPLGASSTLNTPAVSPAGRSKKPRDLGEAPAQTPAPSAAPAPPALSPGTASSLTDEQQAVLRAALGGRSFFFTGGAGTGKSFLLKQILQRLPADTTFATATTGVAACAIGGVTVHHWAGIGDGSRPIAELVSSALRKRGEQWRRARTLVIDEVSMLDGDLFDTLEEVARSARGCTLPFGGLQLILCGDFFQLPPVSRGGASFRFCFEADGWRTCVPRTFELTQVFRQSDQHFLDALAEARAAPLPPRGCSARCVCSRPCGY